VKSKLWTPARRFLREERGGLLAPPQSLAYYVTNNDAPGSATTFGTTVTAHATVNTLGTWVAILPTITYDLYYLKVTFSDVGVASSIPQILVNLGIGPDASNVSVVAENLIASQCGVITGSPGARQYDLPLRIPAGTQLWAQCQSTITVRTVDVAIQGWGGPDISEFQSVSHIRSIGADTANSRGTSFTPGSAAVGAYAQMIASSAEDYVGFSLGIASTDASTGTAGYLCSVGIGAATEENLGLCVTANTTGAETWSSNSWPVWRHVPSGTRIAMRGCAVPSPETLMTAIVYGLMP
jgi:hypothetical protein